MGQPMDFGTVVLYLYCSVISSLLSRSVTPISSADRDVKTTAVRGVVVGIVCVVCGKWVRWGGVAVSLTFTTVSVNFLCRR